MTSSDVSIGYIPCIFLNLSVIALTIQVCGLSLDMATSCRVNAIFSNPTGLSPAQFTPEDFEIPFGVPTASTSPFKQTQSSHSQYSRTRGQPDNCVN